MTIKTLDDCLDAYDAKHKAKLDVLRDRIAALEAENAKLNERVEELEDQNYGLRLNNTSGGGRDSTARKLFLGWKERMEKAEAENARIKKTSDDIASAFFTAKTENARLRAVVEAARPVRDWLVGDYPILTVEERQALSDAMHSLDAAGQPASDDGAGEGGE